ncbi:prefoldin subunit alpha [Candidatus Woesearchaeota archaeon]|nr:prefoldin subunit alpha [Candidatus Woesearchaeota archaeon]
MVEQKDLNEKYIELQILEQQLKQVTQQLLALDQQLLELQRIEENIEDVKKTGKNTDMLVALGGGIFLKAEIKENNKVLMNVGANVVVEKDITASKEVISKQLDQLKDAAKQLEQEFRILAMNSQSAQEELRQFINAKGAAQQN